MVRNGKTISVGLFLCGNPGDLQSLLGHPPVSLRANRAAALIGCGEGA